MDPEPARKSEYKVNISLMVHFFLCTVFITSSKEVKKHGRLVNTEYCQRHKTVLK